MNKLFLALLLLSQSSFATDYIFLIEGQSNASGRGTGAPYTATHATRIFQYGNDNVYKQAVEPLDSITGQVDLVSKESAQAGNGLAIPFADRLLDTCSAFNSTDTITLVPAAWGGASAAQWRQIWSSNNLYGSAINRMFAAQLVSGGVFKGVVHWQGETEAASTAQADTWLDRTSNNLSNMRADLGDLNLPIALFRLNTIYPNVAPFPAWSYLVNTYMNGFKMHNLVNVSTDIAGHSPSNYHFETAEYTAFGIRAADAICPLL
jgi:hypothetical protein